jgi:predicted TIM-barrel fold metal-dependent hydrolase
VSIVVDADAHVNEALPELAQHFDAAYRERTPFVIKDTKGLTRILMEGRLYPEPRLRQAHSKRVEGKDLGGIQAGASDALARLGDLDTEGIDVQVVYGSLALSVTTIADTGFAIALAQALNDYYAAFCVAAPSRLRAMAVVPLQDVDAAVTELRRAVEELGLLGATVPPNVAGRNLDRPEFDPLWAEAQRLDVPVSVHWGNGAYVPAAGNERFDTHFMSHATGHPFEQMIAMASVVCGGLLERFPTLRFGFLEAGCGWVPYWVERLEEHYERRSAEMTAMRRSPREYLAEGRCFVTAEPDEALLPLAVETLGADALLFASDYPHTDSKFPYAVKSLRERDDVNESVKAKVLGDNAQHYYGARLFG